MLSLDSIREVLHVVAGTLLWPVIIGLLLLAAWIVISLGTFAREALDRRRGIFGFRAAVRVRLDAANGPDLDLALERILQEWEHRRWRSLDWVRLAIRLGPSLGLMGTLIPMASALAALASGNLPSLASNMVTAFAATVIGLAISVTAYLISVVREKWVRADMRELAFHAEERLRRTAPSAREDVVDAIR